MSSRGGILRQHRRLLFLLQIIIGVPVSFSLSSKEAATMSSSDGLKWSPVADLLDADPKDLSSSRGEHGPPRLAKDVDFAESVQNIWREEIKTRAGSEAGVKCRALGAPIAYKTSQGTPLFGYAARPDRNDDSLPGIILFHTGAGPQDIFLRWKAESLVTDADLGGCVVLIADIISDDIGWAWSSDRSRYNNARDEVLASITDEDGNMMRKELQRRIQAAVDALVAIEGVDPDRLGALGFCMGGHPVLEIARMNISGMRAVGTFHGVFDAVKGGKQEEEEESSDTDEATASKRPHALICHGSFDPFVKPEELDACKRIFRRNGWDWELLEFDNVRHGFSNPAQDFNPSEAFAFNDHAASASWEAACNLLKRTLVDKE